MAAISKTHTMHMVTCNKCVHLHEVFCYLLQVHRSLLLGIQHPELLLPIVPEIFAQLLASETQTLPGKFGIPTADF